MFEPVFEYDKIAGEPPNHVLDGPTTPGGAPIAHHPPSVTVNRSTHATTWGERPGDR
jgi:hypothetical protein